MRRECNRPQLRTQLFDHRDSLLGGARRPQRLRRERAHRDERRHVRASLRGGRERVFVEAQTREGLAS